MWTHYMEHSYNKSTGSAVTYLMFEFSFQHVLLTRTRVHSAYTVYENALLFSLEY